MIGDGAAFSLLDRIFRANFVPGEGGVSFERQHALIRDTIGPQGVVHDFGVPREQLTPIPGAVCLVE